MSTITIAIGSDHRGFLYKQRLCALPTMGGAPIIWIDVGTDSTQRTDYPLYAQAAVHRLQTKTVDYALLLCGTGVGMSIAANRFPHIFAGIAWNPQVAQRARAEDAINTLVIPADFVSYEETVAIISAWLTTEPLTGRYAERRAMIDACATDV